MTTPENLDQPLQLFGVSSYYVMRTRLCGQFITRKADSNTPWTVDRLLKC